MSGEVWREVYDRLVELILAHRTTLVFVNTRRMAERATRELSIRLGSDRIAAHHGSLAKERRLDAEQRLKRGELKALVATASLELGIDIGEVDLVCQLGSPHSIATLLQRVGRSGHAVDGTPKGRLFPLSRDELVECTALLASVARGELDRVKIPEQPLDVLAQQIVAEVAAQEWAEDELFALCRRAWPYRDLPRADFVEIVRMLAEGFSTRRGRRGALIHHDAVNRMLRGRRGARITALTSGGTIPDTADYQVVLEPENQVIGTVNEDFAVESLAGDVFQLGNAAYRIRRVERGMLRVEDAQGQPPNIPFWLGEAPGRSDELSQSVSLLRAEIAARLDREPSPPGGGRGQGEGGSFDDHPIAPSPQPSPPMGERGIVDWLAQEIGIREAAGRQVVDYLAAGHAALGVLPTQETIVFERFFDAVGGMQLVIHSPYGSRLNRAWGLALRKRFCTRFNFELQAAATEDNIVLSLTTAHSFDLAEVANYLHPATVREVLIQALLDAPMFMTRWRWVAGVALALPRFRGGKKVPPPLLRMDAEDLIAAVFPDQLACAENLAGAREIPDHPLVRQTIADCLDEAMDIAGLERLLARIEAGEVRVVARDLTEPSPLALEVLSARPYAYLDDAPLEERRTQAVMARRWLAPEAAAEIGRLDPEAILRVRREAWPDSANRDELHDALAWLGFLTPEEAAAGPGWPEWLAELAREKRATRVTLSVAPAKAGGQGQAVERLPLGSRLRGNDEREVWVAAERLPQFLALWPEARLEPPITAPAGYAERDWAADEALVEILRGRLEGLGPGERSGAGGAARPCSRTISPRRWPRCRPRGSRCAAASPQGRRRRNGASAGSWRASTATRCAGCAPRSSRSRRATSCASCSSGSGSARSPAWKAPMRSPRCWDSWKASRRRPAPGRPRSCRPASPNTTRPGSTTIASPGASPGRGCGRAAAARGSRPRADSRPVRTTPITLLARRHAALWASLSPEPDAAQASPRAQAVLRFIRDNGASFFDELVDGTGCCGRRSRRRSPSWWRWASSTPTASPGCARC